MAISRIALLHKTNLRSLISDKKSRSSIIKTNTGQLLCKSYLTFFITFFAILKLLYKRVQGCRALGQIKHRAGNVDSINTQLFTKN